jgi:hypothetical protein
MRSSLAVLAVLTAGTSACSEPAPSAETGRGGAATTAGAGGSAGVSGSPAAAAGAGGTAAGAGGTAAGGMAGTSAGGGAGAGGSAGGASGGGAGGSVPSDTPPSRPLDVKATPARHEHTFEASDADPEVSFNDGSQRAILDNRAPKLVGKLVLPFGGAGSTAGYLGGHGEFCARRGFHVLAIAAFQDYNIVIGDAGFYGDARRQVFEGVTHTTKGDFANVKMGKADGVAQRTQKALAYLHDLYPAEDWGYYLQPDGTVRWSDVIFTGMSHGASNAARFAMLVRAWRAVSIAGPRDNACENLNQDDCGGVVATWFDEEPLTPIDRFFAITGKGDEQHTQHLFALERIGYQGEPVAVQSAEPPYGDSRRFIAEGGHEEFCGQAAYDDACNVAFGVPPENHDGVE